MTSRAAAPPPDVVAPPPGNPRFPLLDPLRAVAALCIVLTHTAGLSGFNTAHAAGAWTARLDCGVTIFFVLSGFLLYRPFVAARLDGRTAPSVARYARRRALRILPAYWVALVVLGLLAPQETVGVFGDHWWAYFGLLQSWSPDVLFGGVRVAWSLSVEVAFYILLPLYAVAVARLLGRRGRDAQVRLELAALAASAALALVARTLAHARTPNGVFASTLPGTWSWFAAGLSLAIVSAWLADRPLAQRPRLARAPTEHPLGCWVAAFGLLTVSAWAVGLPRGLDGAYSTASLQAQHVLYLGVAVCLVAPAVLHDGRRSAPAALLSTRVLAWLGLVSYGIFLYHQTFVTELLDTHTWVPFAGIVFYTGLVAAAAIACAAASYYVVERPLLRRKEGGRARRQRTGGTGGSSSRTRAAAVAAKSES